MLSVVGHSKHKRLRIRSHSFNIPNPCHICCRNLTQQQLQQNSSNDDNRKWRLITTAQEGEQWMRELRDTMHIDKDIGIAADTHYSARLQHIDDDVWFGVDTEFSTKSARKAPYNNTKINMLQIYGNYTDEAKRKCNGNIMDKPTIIQLYNTEKECIDYDVLYSVQEFLIDPRYSKVFHNYSVDAHTINNALRSMAKLKNAHNTNACTVRGFAGDTMHMARLLNAGSPENSLKALSIKYNPEGTVKTETLKEYARETLDQEMLPSAIQHKIREEPEKWYEYGASDPVVTFELACKLKQKLSKSTCALRMYHDNQINGEEVKSDREKLNLWDIYHAIWRPFGQLLVEMESAGFYIDAQYLNELELTSTQQRQKSIDEFLDWVVKVTGNEYMRFMNVQSKTQLGLFFFADDSHDVTIKFGSRAKQQNPELKKIKTFQLSHLGLPAKQMTPTGKIKFTSKILDELIESPTGLAARFDESTQETDQAIKAAKSLRDAMSISTQINTFIVPLQQFVDGDESDGGDQRLHFSLNLNTETGRLSCTNPNLQNQPSAKDTFQVRKAFTPQSPDNTLIIADYAQIELRVLAFLSDCESMIEAFESGGDFHSRTAATMFPYIAQDIQRGGVLMDSVDIKESEHGNIPLVKDKYKRERFQAKTLNFSIAYGKSAAGLSNDLGLTVREAEEVLDKWYADRAEVKMWQQRQMIQAITDGFTYSLLGRPRKLFDPLHDLCGGDKELHEQFRYHAKLVFNMNGSDKVDHESMSKLNARGLGVKKLIGVKNKNMGNIWKAFVKEYKLSMSRMNENNAEQVAKNARWPAEKCGALLNRHMRQAINSPVQSGAADIVMKCMLNIWENKRLKQLRYKLLLQIHDEVILEGPKQHRHEAMRIVQQCMELPFIGMKKTVLFKADVQCSDNWYDGN